MIQGELVYMPDSDRYAIMDGADVLHPGLHCGEPLDVLIDGTWIPDRIEYDGVWYLVKSDLRGAGLDGQSVRQGT